ncbi:MAG: serine/threonine protein kinase, partial [Holophagales bacterium]|nr:serine/threonine protein kinase [Holophagales bacterium]
MKPFDPDAETIELEPTGSKSSEERTRTWEEGSPPGSAAMPSAHPGEKASMGVPESSKSPDSPRLGLAELHGSWPPSSLEPTSPWARPDPAAAREARFREGDRIADRYRVVRFLARGGSGEVYEVHDTALDLRVALKTIRPGQAPEQNPLARLKREIQLARQVTHPNVCRLYELGFHRAPDGEDTSRPKPLPPRTPEEEAEGGVHFLTMELLRGRTLFDQLEAEGPFLPGAALEILRQMAAGLDAAHRSGVVHRDFKSGNVVLMPDPGAPGGTRVVITDFGLARPVEPELASRLTAQHLIVGTPEYMAPEQIEGRDVMPATDIYALGIVICEMLTGRLPFEADTPLATAYLRLSESGPSLQALRAALPPGWFEPVRRCLQIDPRARWESAEQLVAALEGSQAHRGPWRAVAWAAGLILLLGVAGSLLWWQTAGSRAVAPIHELGAEVSDSTLGPIAERRSVALFGLRNLSDREEDDWLAAALTEMLATEAAAGDRLRVISGDDITRVRIEIGLDGQENLATSGVARVGEMLGCDLVVNGTYLVVPDEAGDHIRLDLQARSAQDGSLVARIGEQGTEDE